jgi:hypothetical protein
MRKPKVLIGYSRCPLTRQAFEAAGCDVTTCDLRPCEGQGNHIQGDVWHVLAGEGWDFAVLHPMCTYLTVSAAWAYGDGPYHQKVRPETLVGAARRTARHKAIDNVRNLMRLPFPVAIENPASSFLNKAIRPPDQVIQPWQFGDDASKRTGMWLTRGTPPLEIDPENAYPARLVDGKPRWSNQTDSGQNRLGPSAQRWTERSNTYPGIAAAMGAQWGAWLVEQLNHA